MIKKHKRYLLHEGEVKSKQGIIFSWKITIRSTFASLKHNLFDYAGIYGGLTGIFLSIFYSWYVFMSYLSLRDYENACLVGGY